MLHDAPHNNNKPLHTAVWIVAVLVISLLLILLIWWYFEYRIAVIDQKIN